MRLFLSIFLKKICSLFHVSRSTGPFFDRLVSLAASQGSLAQGGRCMWIKKKILNVNIINIEKLDKPEGGAGTMWIG